MSVRMMTLVWDAKIGNLTKKAIALKLADVASDDGSNIYPAVATIARQTEVDVRTVQRTLQAFLGEKPGDNLLTYEQRNGKPCKGGGRNKTARYVMSIDWLHANRNPDTPPGFNPPEKPRQPAGVSAVNPGTESRNPGTVPGEPLEPRKKEGFSRKKQVHAQPLGALLKRLGYADTSVRDTEESFADMRARLIAEGKYQP